MTKSKFGVMFGVKKRQKKVEWHPTEFARNLAAKSYKSAGYRVRKLTKKVV